eukprot:9036263-Pyramimonas_sp.AAC.1
MEVGREVEGKWEGSGTNLLQGLVRTGVHARAPLLARESREAAQARTSLALVVRRFGTLEANHARASCARAKA